MEKPKQFIIDNGGPYLQVLINGKYVAVKCGNVSQMERYGKLIDNRTREALDRLKEMQEREKSGTEKKDPEPQTQEYLEKTMEEYLETAGIILNPDTDEIKYSRDDLAKEFDLVGLSCLVKAWRFKIENQNPEPNPQFAPQKAA